MIEKLHDGKLKHQIHPIAFASNGGGEMQYQQY